MPLDERRCTLATFASVAPWDGLARATNNHARGHVASSLASYFYHPAGFVLGRHIKLPAMQICALCKQNSTFIMCKYDFQSD